MDLERDKSNNLLTADDVGRRLSCSRSMVYKLRKAGSLPAQLKLFDGEKGYRWTQQAVDAFIQSRILLSELPEPVTAPGKFVAVRSPFANVS